MSNCVRYSCGSISCLRQVEVRLARMAAVRPPRGLPTNKEFLRLWKSCHNRNYVQFRIMRSAGVGSGKTVLESSLRLFSRCA